MLIKKTISRRSFQSKILLFYEKSPRQSDGFTIGILSRFSFVVEKVSDKRFIYFVRRSWPEVIFTQGIVLLLAQHLYVYERNRIGQSVSTRIISIFQRF